MRDARYSLLRGYFHGADDEEDDFEREGVRLQSVSLPASADAVGRTLGDLSLDDLGVNVTAIRRHGIRGVEPDPSTRLRADDILVLRGLPDALAKAEQRLSVNRRNQPSTV
jgi:CPA2 family monovalent cation:H+ antiporter-2